jgi:hypothetical protein
MHNQERYEDAVHRLARRGYEVLPDKRGSSVQCLTDSGDV